MIRKGFCYENEIIKEEVQSSAHIHTDDTGWKIGGKRAQLMGFFSEDTSYYQIRHKHGAGEVAEVAEVAEVIDPETCKSTLNTDRFKTYDAEIFECIVMQKCLSHLQKNLSDQLENKQGRARTFCENLKSLFKQSLELWHRYRAQEIELADYLECGRKLDDELTYQLTLFVDVYSVVHDLIWFGFGFGFGFRFRFRGLIEWFCPYLGKLRSAVTSNRGFFDRQCVTKSGSLKSGCFGDDLNSAAILPAQ